MRCLSCRRFSLRVVCDVCRDLYLTPQPKIRKLSSGLEVLSFYAYDEIEPFLLTKHLPHGWLVYCLLAEQAFSVFEKPITPLAAIAVDDDATGGYSHTALLAKALKARGCVVFPGALRASDRVSYAGRSLAFRLAHPRRFRYTGPGRIETVLVDDIVTTGLTLQEAQKVLNGADVEVSFAMVLADADRR